MRKYIVMILVLFISAVTSSVFAQESQEKGLKPVHGLPVYVEEKKDATTTVPASSTTPSTTDSLMPPEPEEVTETSSETASVKEKKCTEISETKEFVSEKKFRHWRVGIGKIGLDQYSTDENPSLFRIRNVGNPSRWTLSGELIIPTPRGINVGFEVGTDFGYHEETAEINGTNLGTLTSRDTFDLILNFYKDIGNDTSLYFSAGEVYVDRNGKVGMGGYYFPTTQSSWEPEAKIGVQLPIADWLAIRGEYVFRLSSQEVFIPDAVTIGTKLTSSIGVSANVLF